MPSTRMTDLTCPRATFPAPRDMNTKASHGEALRAAILRAAAGKHFGTILADPPWQFDNRTGKVAPEHKRLGRYLTLTKDEILELPVSEIAAEKSHLYLWVPNALIGDGLEVMQRWGFRYKTNIVWLKLRRDGGPDGRGVGFYFRNVTELVLFGVRGHLRTLKPGRTQTNIIATRKREHSRKPDELYDLIERCSPAPFMELFARQRRQGWTSWGNEADSPPGPFGKTTKGYAWDVTGTYTGPRLPSHFRFERTLRPAERTLRSPIPKS